jgi:hypothetical protein
LDDLERYRELAPKKRRPVATVSSGSIPVSGPRSLLSNWQGKSEDRRSPDTIPATGVLGAYFPLEIFRICFRKCTRNVRFKKQELLFIRRMLKAGISPKKIGDYAFFCRFFG